MDVEKTMEFILEQLAHATAVQAKIEELQAKAEERQAKADQRLNRAIRLAVTCQERKRRQKLHWEVDEKITQLAAAQLITEEKLQRLINERRGANGKN